MPLEAGTRFGQYQVIAPLGAGGMGEVYRAHDSRLDRVVALKFIREDLVGDAEMRLRFEREARALASLDHPYVGTVHGFEEVDGRRFMVLAFVEGRTLDALLAGQPLPPARARVILPRIAEGLAAAHARGIVHRDIKCSNVLVGPNDVPKLVDFGLAQREHDARLTESAVGAVGTLACMAPEVLRGADADARSDQFSLGVLLYEALTGRNPFARSHPAATLQAILNDDPAAFPADLAAQNRALEPVVRRCLEKLAERRFADVGAVAVALGGDPVATDRTMPMGVPRTAPAGARLGRLALGLVTLAVVAIASFLLLRSRPASPAVHEHSVAVLDFENDTGDASLDWMARGLAELLGTALSRSQELDVYDAQRLAQLPAAAADASHFAGAIQALRRIGVVRAVVGSVLKSNGRLRIQGRVIDVSSGRVIHSEWVEGSATGDVFQLAGGLIQGLQTSLEVDVIGANTGDQWLHEITTSSTDAYRLYLSGRRVFIQSRWAEAAGYYEQSLALDSTFAAARSDLTGCYWNLEDAARTRRSLDAARRLVARSSRHDALQLELIIAVVTANADGIIRSATELRTLYPGNRFFTYLLSRGYYVAGRYRDCLAVLEPLVRERYEWAGTYLLSGRAHAHLGNNPEARRHFELGMKVTGDDPELAYDYAMFLKSIGDVGGARGVLRRAEGSSKLPQTPSVEASIRLEMGKYYQQAGQADSARAEFTRALAGAPRGSDDAKAAAGELGEAVTR